MFSRKSMLMTAALLRLQSSPRPPRPSPPTIKPAVVYDLGGKFDKSFNEGVFNGATKFSKDTGVAFRDLEIQNDAQREQVLRKFAKDGFSPIMTVGFAWATALGKVADEFPNTKFGIIDMVVDKPNVQSIVFKEHEGSFLVGVHRRQDLEDRQGRLRRRHGHSADLEVRVRLRPGGQIRLRRQGRGVRQHDRHDAGRLERSGQGRRTGQVADRSRRRHRLRCGGRDRPGRAQGGRRRRQAGIGVDSDQDYLFPGKVLTSMLKHVDVATYKSFMDAKNGTWKPGVQVLGLKEGGVDYAVDEYNKSLLTPEAKAKVDAAKADIISGKIQIHDYMSDNKCPT